jgi:leader peptidase (prepilin peptidase)/N-methyltransferase
MMVLWGGLFGSLVGSFLNVVIARVPAGESVVSPRSRCPSCGKLIAWYDNIPLLSWALLRARCRSCGTSISARYPLVELVVACLGVGVVSRYGFSLTGAELFVFSVVLVAVAFIDLDTWTIPLVLPGILLVLGLALGGVGDALDAPWAIPAWLRPALGPDSSALAERGIGAVGGGLALALLNVVATWAARRSGRIEGDEWAMGWGDPFLLAGIGAVLGWRALPLVIFLGSMQGTVVAIVLRLVGRMPAEVERERVAAAQAAGEELEDDWVPPPTAVPFGPFLALGGLEVAFFGGWIAERVSALGTVI